MNFTRLILCVSLLAGLPFTACSAEDPKPQPAPPSTHGPKPPLPAAVKNVGVDEFAKLRAGTNAVAIDVRTAKEFAAGHIPGAVNLDVNAPDFEQKAAVLDKSKTYLVHCAAGVRSAQACVKMEKLKLPNLVNLEPGLNGWKKAGQPVEQ